jgi:hypothetical protein
MRAPALPLTAPPPTGGGDRKPCTPAPVETMLAVLARIASHAGRDPLSLTITQPGHAVDVNVRDRAQYDAWRWYVAEQGPLVRGDDLGLTGESEASLHGWRLRLRLVP